MMQLTLIRADIEKEDQELPLLQSISSVELTEPQKLQPQKHIQRVQVTDTSQHQLFRVDCVLGRHGQSKEETTTKGQQEEEEDTCLGQETRAMDIRPVEICSLVWSQIGDFWFQPPCLCEVQSR
jgi:hypothetical protein